MTALALFAVTLAGWLTIARLDARLSQIERAALGWCTGIGAVTFLMFLANALGLSLTPLLAWAAIGSLVLVGFVLSWGALPIGKFAALHRQPFDPLQVWAMVVLILLLAVTILQGNYWPIYDNDSLSTYDFRARLMLAEGTLNVSAYPRGIMGGGRFYPPLVPMAYLLVYLSEGSQPKIITTLFWLSLVAMIYGRLRRHASRWPATIFTLVMVASPQLLLYATHGMTNIPFAAYLASAALYLSAWNETGRRGYFWLGVALLAGAVWTRSADALLLAGMMWLWALLHRPTRKRISIPTWIASGLFIAGPALLWQIYVVSVIGFPAFTGPGAGNLQLYFSARRLLETAWSLVVQVLDPRLFGFSGIAFALGVFVPLIGRTPCRSAALLRMISLLLLAWIVLFYTIELETRYHTLYNSGQRTLMAYVPVLVYFAGRQESLIRPLERLSALSRRWWNGTP